MRAGTLLEFGAAASPTSGLEMTSRRDGERVPIAASSMP